jgi:hypothetical protein
MTVAVIGCASYEPGVTYHDFSKARLPTAMQSQGGLEISIEEFISKDKALQAFDSNIAAQGVFAALVRAQNNAGASYRISRSQINLRLDGERLPVLDAINAATQGAAKDPSGRALAWAAATGPFSLLFIPAALIGSSVHTESVNKTIQQHFTSLELPDTLLKPGQSAAGLVYFKLPGGLSRLEDAVMEIEATGDPGGQTFFYKFTVPPLDIELPPSPNDRQKPEE